MEEFAKINQFSEMFFKMSRTRQSFYQKNQKEIFRNLQQCSISAVLDHVDYELTSLVHRIMLTEALLFCIKRDESTEVPILEKEL